MEILSEKKCVFDKSLELIKDNEKNKFNNEPQINPMEIEEGMQSNLNFLAGVVKADDEIRMKRMIFRASKDTAGATFFDYVDTDIMEKEGAMKIEKKIFTILFQGGTENVLLHKLLQICDLYGASRYNIPNKENMQIEVEALHKEILEKKNFLMEAKNSIKNFFKDKMGSGVSVYKLYIKCLYSAYKMLIKCLQSVYKLFIKCLQSVY